MEFVTGLRGSWSEQKPSLFELLSEQQLKGLLAPTLRYLLTVATQRRPRYLLRVLNRFDELYALAMLLVERHYLRTRAGTFTEHFYGLRRERAPRAEVPRAARGAAPLLRRTLRLSGPDVWRSLAVAVGVPYVKRKLDEAHEVEAPRALLVVPGGGGGGGGGGGYWRLAADAGVRQRLLHYYRRFLGDVYPSLHAAYCFALLAFNLAYLFDNSRHHSPLLWLIGTRVRRMTAADYQAIEAADREAAPARPGQPPGPVSFFSARTLGSRALGSLSVLLPTSIFALKFLEWWYASDFAKQLSRRAAENVDLPPPLVAGPAKSKPGRVTAPRREEDGGQEEEEEHKEQAEEAERLDVVAENAPIATPSLLPILTVRAAEDSQLCPICQEEVQTATACPTGVVYCYSCIHRWVDGSHPRQEDFMADKAGRWESGQGRCAVTGRRILGGTEALRRIMV